MSQHSSDKGYHSKHHHQKHVQDKFRKKQPFHFQQQLQDPSYGQYEFDQDPRTYKYSDQSKKEYKDPSLPINKFLEGRELAVQVVADKESGEEVVVVIKNSVKSFQYFSDEHYRDKRSKKSNQVNAASQPPMAADLKKFYKKRYYLFSKFDRGIKIDDEGWYSVTPEPIAKHIANKAFEALTPKNPIVVLDGFCGVGGNLIQFAKKCGYCIGNDFDQVKVQYTEHNAGIYSVCDKIKVINKDYLELQHSDFSLPVQLGPAGVDAIFLSPPWGGTGYNQLQEYSLQHIFPDFTQMIMKSLEFSRNLMLFLPKNTSIDELIAYLVPFTKQLSKEGSSSRKKNELMLEIEQLYFGQSCKALLVCSGELCRVDSREMVSYFCSNFCNKYDQGDDSYLKALLNNIFQLCGYSPFLKYFKKEGTAKISLSKVIKKIQSTFSEEEWAYLKKYHKKSRTNSKLSSTQSAVSNASMEEEKVSKSLGGANSDSSSFTSGNRSNKSGSFRGKKRYQKRHQEQEEANSEMEAIAEDYFERDDIECRSNEEEEEEKDWLKKTAGKRNVHCLFESGQTHIELKDLSEKDFVELIEGKNSDKRFYGWLHFDPWVGENHKDKTNPQEDMEYFRQLYDKNLFNYENDKEKESGNENMKDAQDP